MKYDRERIGLRLKSLRADKGLSQAALAEATGVSESMISAIETGKTGIGLDTALIITDVLGCSLEKLVCRGS